MKGTPSPPPQDQGQEKKHMDHDYSPEDTGLVGLSPSQLPAYPRPIATPQQLYAAAAAPIAPLSYRQQQVHPRQDDYAQQGHFTSRSDYTNNYNVYNDNYINNAMWSYPAIRNDGQEELAHKGDYPSGSRATSIAVKGGDYPPYFDAFSEEIGYKGEYPPYVEDNSSNSSEREGEEGGTGGEAGAAGGSSNVTAGMASKEGHYGPKDFFKNVRNYRRKEFWIVVAVAVIFLLVVVFGSILLSRSKNDNNNNSGGLGESNNNNNNSNTSDRGAGTGIERTTTPVTSWSRATSTETFIMPSSTIGGGILPTVEPDFPTDTNAPTISATTPSTTAPAITSPTTTPPTTTIAVTTTTADKSSFHPVPTVHSPTRESRTTTLA